MVAAHFLLRRADHEGGGRQRLLLGAEPGREPESLDGLRLEHPRGQELLQLAPAQRVRGVREGHVERAGHPRRRVARVGVVGVEPVRAKALAPHVIERARHELVEVRVELLLGQVALTPAADAADVELLAHGLHGRSVRPIEARIIDEPGHHAHPVDLRLAEQARVSSIT